MEKQKSIEVIFTLGLIRGGGGHNLLFNPFQYKMNEYFEPRCCAGPRWSPSRSPTAPAPLHANSSSGTFPGSQDALYI